MDKKSIKTGLLITIAGFLYYAKCSLLNKEPCEENCQRIISETQLLLCLDSCSVNANAVLNPYTPSKLKVFMILFIVFSLAIFIIRMIQHLYIKQVKNKKCKAIEEEEEEEEQINNIDNHYSKLDN